MYFSTKNILFKRRSYNNILLVYLCYLFVFNTCKNPSLSDAHPGYFNTIYKKVDSADGQTKEQAIAFMDSAFKAFPKAGIIDNVEMLTRKRDFYFMVKRDIEHANALNDSILFLLEDKTDAENFALLYARSLFRKADFLMAQKKYDESFRFYFQGKQLITDKVKDPCALAGYSGRVGMLFYAQGKYHLAAGYFYQNYLDQCNCEKDKFFRFASLQESLDNVGICYNEMGMTDSASYYFTAALNFIQQHEAALPEKGYYISIAKAVVYGNQADILSKKGDYAAAETLFVKSIGITKNYDMGFTHSTMVKLAATYLKHNETANADKMMQAIKLSLDTIPDEPSLIKWYKLKKDYYRMKNEIAQAFEYQEKYHLAKDSVEAANKKFIAMDINREFENREQKAITENLQKDNRLKNTYFLIAALTSLMSIAIIILVWYNLKRSKKHVTELEILNDDVQLKNDDLQKAFSSLEQSHKENSRIIKIVAHDLKNPISAINNLVFSLLKKKPPEELKEILELIQNACTNSIALIKDLLSEKKQLADIKKEMVDMGRLLEYCIDLLQAKADEKNQHLTLTTDHAVVMLNRQKMWRVISNLVNNAIKFSPENAVIDIRLKRKKDTVLLSVHDNGIGIPAELKNKIFELAPEASRPGTQGEESHGLGLSISQKIIAEHKGKIWFESEGGEGAVFYVELPYAN